MSWVKLCDRSLQRICARRAGTSAMGFWAGAMCHSAHELLDGRLTADELEGDVWWGDFRSDADLWHGLLKDELKRRLGDVEGAEEILGVVRVAFAAVGKDTAAVSAALRERLCDVKLMKRPRGRGQHYELLHPDGDPYCKEDGGDQFSRASTLERREREAEAKRRQREATREKDQLEQQLGLGKPLSERQVAEMLRQPELSSADAEEDAAVDGCAGAAPSSLSSLWSQSAHGDVPSEAMRGAAAPTSVVSGAAARSRRRRTRKPPSPARSAPSPTLPGGDPRAPDASDSHQGADGGEFSASEPSAPSLNFGIHPSRPSLDNLNSSVEIPSEVHALQRELRQHPILLPFADEDWSLALALYRSLSAMRVGVEGALLAIRETAAAANVRAALGTIHSLRQWVSTTLLDRLSKATDGKLSEVEHLERKRRSLPRPPQATRRHLEGRQRREEDERMAARDVARQAGLAALAAAAAGGSAPET